MKNTILLFTFISISVISVAQTDSIATRIRNYEDSKSVIISKGRALLLDEFLAGDLQKVGEVMTYFRKEVDDADYITLYPNEEWLLCYWIKDYSLLKSCLLQYDSVFITNFRRKIRPQTDLLSQKVEERTAGSFDILQQELTFSELDQSDREFYSFLLKYLLLDGSQIHQMQDSINVECKEYIAKYPGSEFNPFIRKYFLVEYKQNKWGMGFEFFSGYGIFTGDLGKCFTNNIPFGVEFDINYKKLVLYLRDYIGFGKTLRDMAFGEFTWKEDSRSSIVMGGATLGYHIIDNRFARIAPFAGINATYVSATEKDKKEMGAEYETIGPAGASVTAGLNIDFKLRKRKQVQVQYMPVNEYTFIRLRFEYNHPPFAGKYDAYAGNIYNITLGVGGFASKIKRKY